ncbi:MAG: tyrosine-type recombinase/integrase [Candidatus Microthrix sp.]|nr:tyrosine-type recombinase/integrase [Candidatus Microthrix sp.]
MHVADRHRRGTRPRLQLGSGLVVQHDRSHFEHCLSPLIDNPTRLHACHLRGTALVRLGLRTGEVAGIELDDIDWRGGELHIRGKAGRVDVLPLPVEVGRALAEYVRTGRPRVGHRVVFCRIGAPHTPLVPATVTQIVYRCCDRAGLRRVGSHRLRHTAATHMLGGGASLPEIGQVLRHTSTATTAIYAKVDRRALSGLAQSWPGGAA